MSLSDNEPYRISSAALAASGVKQNRSLPGNREMDRTPSIRFRVQSTYRRTRNKTSAARIHVRSPDHCVHLWLNGRISRGREVIRREIGQNFNVVDTLGS
jgi:hypothetical protein